MITDNRFLNDEYECILSMIEQELPHGSGFDGEWNLKLTTPTRVNAFASYHCMNDAGYYDGWVDFTVHFDIAKDDVFKVTFRSNSKNRWRAEKYLLRDYIEEMVCESLYKTIWDSPWKQEWDRLSKKIKELETTEVNECKAPDASFTSHHCLVCEIKNCPHNNQEN